MTPWTAAHQASLSFTISWSCTNSCPLNWWCHPVISSSITPFSSSPQSFPTLGSFPVRQHFASSGQSIRVSTSASVLPTNIQSWFTLRLTSLISFLPKGLSRVLQHHNLKASVLQCSVFFMVQLSHPYMTVLICWEFPRGLDNSTSVMWLVGFLLLNKVFYGGKVSGALGELAGVS